MLVKGIRYLEKALSNPVDKNGINKNTRTKAIFGKSLTVSVLAVESSSGNFSLKNNLSILKKMYLLQLLGEISLR